MKINNRITLSDSSLKFDETTYLFPSSLRPDNMNSEIRSKYDENDSNLLQLGSIMPDVYVKRMGLTGITASSLEFEAECEFENPLAIQMNVTSIELNIGSSGSTAVHLTISNVNGDWEIIYPDPKDSSISTRIQTMTFKVKMDLTGSGSVISQLTGLALLGGNLQILNSFNYNRVLGGKLVENMTSNLQIGIPTVTSQVVSKLTNLFIKYFGSSLLSSVISGATTAASAQAGNVINQVTSFIP